MPGLNKENGNIVKNMKKTGITKGRKKAGMSVYSGRFGNQSLVVNAICYDVKTSLITSLKSRCHASL